MSIRDKRSLLPAIERRLDLVTARAPGALRDGCSLARPACTVPSTAAAASQGSGCSHGWCSGRAQNRRRERPRRHRSVSARTWLASSASPGRRRDKAAAAGARRQPGGKATRLIFAAATHSTQRRGCHTQAHCQVENPAAYVLRQGWAGKNGGEGGN